LIVDAITALKHGKGHITDTISKNKDKKPVIVPMPSPSYSTSTTDCYVNLKKMLANLSEFV